MRLYLATRNENFRIIIGLGPFVIEPAITRKIGSAAFAQLSLEGNWKTAKWAKKKVYIILS